MKLRRYPTNLWRDGTSSMRMYSLIIFWLFLIGCADSSDSSVNSLADSMQQEANKNRDEDGSRSSVVIRYKIAQTYFIGHSLMKGIADALWSEFSPLVWSFQTWASLRDEAKFDKDIEYVNNNPEIKNIVIYLGMNDFNDDWDLQGNVDAVLHKLTSLSHKFVGKNIYIVWLTPLTWKVTRRLYSDQLKFVDMVNEGLQKNAKTQWFVFIPDPVRYIDTLWKTWLRDGDFHLSAKWSLQAWVYILECIK